MEAVFELIDNNVKRDRRGRKIRNMAERVRLVESYLASGLTQLDFSKREGVSKNTLVYWLKLYRDRQPSEKSEHFVEVGTVASRANSMEVLLPDGVCIRSASVDQIVAIIKALK